jgi:hypothetical protein
MAMKEDGTVQFQDLHEILHDAQILRTTDLVNWLRRHFEDRRQSRLEKQARLPVSVTTVQRSAI